MQYANAWSGRLAVLWNDGVRHSFDQGLLDISFYVVPRGAPPAEKRAAMKFLHEQRHILFHGHEPLDTDTTPNLEGEAWLLSRKRSGIRTHPSS